MSARFGGRRGGPDRPTGARDPAASNSRIPTDAVQDPAASPRLYDELAGWFHLLTAPEDYVDEAAWTIETLRTHAERPIGALLELGSGGGDLASNLPPEIALTLTDLSPAMLDLSRTILPRAEHLQGDMRTLRLERRFDAVLVHDAIVYMLTQDDLRAAMTTAYLHLEAGGAAIFLPDHVSESFVATTDHGGHDGGGRALRYLEWSHPPGPGEDRIVVDFAMILREADGTVRVVGDRHVEGLFPEATWLALLAEVGFRPTVLTDPWERRVFVGVRAGGPPADR